MENSSITKRLIDFGIDDNEYDEVLEPDDQQLQQKQHQPNSQQQKQQQQNNNQNQNTNQSQHHHKEEQQQHQPPPLSSATPPQLPPPKQNKSVKNSKKNSSKKTKIPRSPSCASSLSYNNSFIHQHTTSSPSSTTSIPPQTPPLPASYQNKNKHMNGGSTTRVTPTPTGAITATTPTTPATPTLNLTTPSPTTPTVAISAIGNSHIINSNNNNNVHSPSSGLVGSGVMGANGNHAQQRGVGGVGSSGVGSGINPAATRRPQIQISPIAESSPKHYQYMTLTVRKDENGYGMKVSGDNPVYVESVKPGGAAQIAGLVAGDMILKVNGQEVRSEKHPTVVSLIKASTIVELAVKRTPKMARPTSVGIVPSTPILSGRDRTASITGPQPVDSIKRREMETYKIQTLQKMLEQEKLNLERLKGETNNPSYKLSEANIRKLREQLRQVGAEVLGQTPPNLNHFNKHRRVVSSPENMHPRHPDRHIKTTSGSWDLIEKDGEITPPGTPPPPYPTSSTHSHSHSTISAMSASQQTLQGSYSEDPAMIGGVFEGGIFVESHHFVPLGSGVSGATSPTLHSATRNMYTAQTVGCQKDIMSMEDDDGSDQECFIDENGPFLYLQRLLEQENVAFLAVFLNYVLSNSDPAPLLFYLITGLYKEGTAKDMRKWAYEIHSTFLVPRAPLSWYRQDESLAREVDNVLQTEFDKVEILRKVFWKSRKRARSIIIEQLYEFQAKRTAGLGTLFGPSDTQLAESKGDKQKEQHIFEDTLMRQLQFLIDDYEKDLPVEDPKKLALCSALSTVIHRIFITRSNPNSIIDRVHHFVSREKSFKSRLMGKNRKMIVRGHPLVLRQYYEVTHCNHCQTIIWGVSPQGYHCTDCKLNIHRPCSKVLDENCPGPLPQAKRKDPHNDNKISKFMGKIRPRTSSDFIAMEKRARHEDDIDPADFSNERLHSTSIVRQHSDRRPDAANTSIRSNGNTSQHNSDLHNTQVLDAGATAADAGSSGATSNAAGTDANAQDAADSGRDARRDRLQHQHQQNKSAPVSVNRSESYKERLSHKRNRNSRRKTSDPSLTSRPNDEQPDLGLSNSNYTASSNSSLSSGGGSESPSTSMEQVTTGAPGQHQQAQHAHQHHHHHQHSHQDSFHGSTGGGSGSGSNANNISFWSGSVGGAGGPTIGQLARQWQFESDEEDDLLIEADWSSNVAADILAALTDAEKKRQEIINEIYQTERNHVRTLKLLERLFFCPLQESGVLSIDHLLLLFPPALLTLRELHSSFEQKLKQRRMEHNHVVNQVGDLLAGMFDGHSGDELREYAAQFCARQQIALEALKEKRRKDEQLQKILSKAESHKACRRLQLKDLLPTVLQRLTKYPLLFENLYKVTIRVVPDDLSEAEAIQRALESSKKILVDVNQAVKHAEDAHKLQNIQRKLDKSTFDKEEFKNLDLTQHRLIHDGSLTMKKNPGIQLHGLLFESMIVLLTKQDDKYSLKYLNATRISEVNNKPLSPIMNIDSETLVRQEAADKNSFFLIKTKTSQMLELRAPSSSECKTWFKHISDAAEQYKPRSKNANHEPVDDPAIATLPHSNTKESLELTPERPPPLTATATVTTTPLAPMMMMPNNNQHHQYQHQHPSADMRNEREGMPATDMTVSMSAVISTASSVRNNHMNNNDLLASSAVNRTMSTRSCGESNNNYSGDRTQQQAYAANNGVTLRHTQSARQATNGEATTNSSVDETGVGSGSKRDSNSIIYSNNSNNTRTLMQSSAPLVEPTAIQISISPAHTAEPVLTPAEKLRRLDASIRDGLLEKQKIICDMFRLPIEHFHEIVDIASLPEAPKDSADIALAAYAQVQSLTEVVNDYMKVTPEQEISAVSTSVCDQCHEKQRKQLHSCNSSNASRTPLAPMIPPGSTAGSLSTSSTLTTTKRMRSPSPPPLPPPNKQQAQAQHKTATPPAKLQTHSLDEQIIHEDDDGYCEIDELRLPALPSMMSASMMSALLSKPAAALSSSAPPPLPPPAETFKVPPIPPPPPSAAVVAAATAANIAGTSCTTERSSSTSPELTKRQSTISADSIPEESADEVTQAMDDSHQPAASPNPNISSIPSTNSTSVTSEPVKSIGALTNDASANATSVEENYEIKDEVKEEQVSKEKAQVEPEEESAPVAEAASENLENKDKNQEEHQETEAEIDSASSSTSTAKTTAEGEDDENKVVKEEKKEQMQEKENSELDTNTEDKNNEEVSATQSAEPQRQNSAATTADAESLDSEHIEINDAFEALATLNKLNTALTMVDSMSQTTLTGSGIAITTTTNTNTTHCGPNRIMHATSLEPSVPCHALNSIVTALNSQISLLLPKINERDMERERLRKENQHLRELLNAMHERQRVEAKIETPKDITTSADANDEIDASSKSTSTATNNNSKPTATSATLTEATTAVATATETAPTISADVAPAKADK